MLGRVGSFAAKVYCGNNRIILRMSHLISVMLKYSISVDDIDRKILAELQENGRLTVTELADRVRLTPAPCHRRLRELERTGVITGYRAVLDLSLIHI